MHLTTEDNRNITRLHARDGRRRPRLYTAEWNDDFHNVAHVIATGETEGYYVDFAEDRWGKLARALAEGFAYQGEPSRYEDGRAAGRAERAPAAARLRRLPAEPRPGRQPRLRRAADDAGAGPAMVEALTAILLLSPHVPLLFMGEEWGETRPFAFFTDFEGELADAVREGRRREFRGLRRVPRRRGAGRDPRPERARRASPPRSSTGPRARPRRAGGWLGVHPAAARRSGGARSCPGSAGAPGHGGRVLARRRRGDRRRLAARRRGAAAAREPRGPAGGAAAGGGAGRSSPSVPRRRTRCRAFAVARRARGGMTPARHLPAAVRPGLRLRRGGGARALPRGARGQPRLRGADLRGAARAAPTATT